MSYWNLEEKLEDAIRGYLVATLTSYTIVKAFDCSDVSEPFVGISCTQSEPYVPGDGTNIGIRLCRVSIEIRSHSGDSARTDHKAMVAAVLDLLYQTDIETQLNNVGITNLGIQDVQITGLTRMAVDRSLVTNQELEVVCHPS